MPLPIVAASDAPADIQAAAGWVCDGTADEVQINAAIAQGPTLLSQGTFTIAAPIVLRSDGAVLRGSGGLSTGHGSVIALASGFAGDAAVLVETSGNEIVARAHLADFRVVGTGSATANVDGVKFRSYQGVVHDISCFDMTGNGFVFIGNESPDPAWSPYDTRAYSLHANQCTLNGCVMGTDGHLMGSIFHTNTEAGIYLGDAASPQITQVHCYGNNIGIHLYDGGGVRSKISNCKIEHSAEHGIWLEGDGGANATSVQIIGCGFNSNGKSVDNSFSDIAVTGVQQANGLTVIGNQFGNSDSTPNEPQYNLRLTSSSPNATVIGNRFSNFVTAAVLHSSTTSLTLRMVGNQNVDDYYGSSAPTATMQAGAGTSPPAAVIVANSLDTRGQITTGTGTTPAAGNQVIVNFATARTNANYRVALTPGNSAAALLDPYISARTTSGFTIATAGTPAASQANTVYAWDYVVQL
jgi:hypothetical protein